MALYGDLSPTRAGLCGHFECPFEHIDRAKRVASQVQDEKLVYPINAQRARRAVTCEWRSLKSCQGNGGRSTPSERKVKRLVILFLIYIGDKAERGHLNCMRDSKCRNGQTNRRRKQTKLR